MPNVFKISSLHLKAALLSYWRFKKQFICADEVGVCLTNADIMVDTGRFLIEVEVKTSKSDLVQGEKKKDKHIRYAKPIGTLDHRYVPNQYYICVPTGLVEVAKEWCEKINPKYGVLEYRPDHYYGYKWEDMIVTEKRAKFLHEEKITEHQRHEIVHRLASSRATYYQELAKNYIEPIEEDFTI